MHFFRNIGDIVLETSFLLLLHQKNFTVVIVFPHLFQPSFILQQHRQEEPTRDEDEMNNEGVCRNLRKRSLPSKIIMLSCVL